MTLKTIFLGRLRVTVSEILANITENTLNAIRNIKNTRKNIYNRIGKQHNKILNLILALINPHRAHLYQVGFPLQTDFRNSEKRVTSEFDLYAVHLNVKENRHAAKR